MFGFLKGCVCVWRMESGKVWIGKRDDMDVVEVHWLPCRMKSSGTTAYDARFRPNDGEVSFRGRHLLGAEVKLPENFRGRRRRGGEISFFSRSHHTKETKEKRNASASSFPPFSTPKIENEPWGSDLPFSTQCHRCRCRRRRPLGRSPVHTQ